MGNIMKKKRPDAGVMDPSYRQLRRPRRVTDPLDEETIELAIQRRPFLASKYRTALAWADAELARIAASAR
jgi:hypothetical protein